MGGLGRQTSPIDRETATLDHHLGPPAWTQRPAVRSGSDRTLAWTSRLASGSGDSALRLGAASGPPDHRRGRMSDRATGPLGQIGDLWLGPPVKPAALRVFAAPLRKEKARRRGGAKGMQTDNFCR